MPNRRGRVYHHSERNGLKSSASCLSPTPSLRYTLPSTSATSSRVSLARPGSSRSLAPPRTGMSAPSSRRSSPQLGREPAHYSAAPYPPRPQAEPSTAPRPPRHEQSSPQPARRAPHLYQHSVARSSFSICRACHITVRRPPRSGSRRCGRYEQVGPEFALQQGHVLAQRRLCVRCSSRAAAVKLPHWINLRELVQIRRLHRLRPPRPARPSRGPGR